MRAQIEERTERVLRIQKVDSMGRTRETREAMETNERHLRHWKIGDAALEIAAIVGQEHSTYPKAMYRLALKNGQPAGDIKDPDYPLPFDLAQQLGLTECGFRVIGKNANSPGNVVVRLPYITRMVGVVQEDLSIDLEAARAEEERLRKLGWVDSPNKIKGLPVPAAEQGYDPLPDEAVEAKRNGARG